MTKTGYQKGAKTFADANGILLYELREPTEKDWEGRTKSIVIELNFICPESSDIKIVPDNEWIIEERQKREIPDDESIPIHISGSWDEIVIYDENDKKIATIQDIIEPFFPPGFEEILPTQKKHIFSDPAFIHTWIDRFPKIKIEAIKATISTSKTVEEVRFNAEDIVGFILKNVTEDSYHTFDKNLNLIK